MKRILFALVPAVLLMPQLALGAPDAALSPVQEPIPAGLTSCFNYYTFGSTPISLTPSLRTVAAGAPIAFSGVISNSNAYPIVNASIWVKVFRERTQNGAKDQNGPDVVDFFKAAGPITLTAGEESPVSFIWQVPKNEPAGAYQVATYVVASDEFNFSGLTFTDDVTGSLADFSVIGRSDGISFDKASVTVDSQPYAFAGFAPTVPATGPVPVHAIVTNTTALPATAMLVWDLYSWDSVTPGAHLSRQTQTISVPAGGSMPISYVATDAQHGVYYLVGTLVANGTKSIIGVRFVRGGIDTPRLNVVGVTGYPLSAGSTLFACVHDTGTAQAEGTSLTVSIVPTDPVERFVDSVFGMTTTLSYSGPVPPQEVALAGAARATPNSFDVVADLYQKGALVDEVSVPYECGALGVPCGVSDTDLAAGALVLALLAVAAIYLPRSRHYRDNRTDV